MHLRALLAVVTISVDTGEIQIANAVQDLYAEVKSLTSKFRPRTDTVK